jgi:hypothetical protein
MSEVLIRLSEWLCARGGRYFRNLKVHADNACPQKSAVSQQFMARKGIVVAAHPPYLPDLASSDFEIGAIIIGSRRHFWVPQKVDFDQGFSRVDGEARAIY